MDPVNLARHLLPVGMWWPSRISVFEATACERQVCETYLSAHPGEYMQVASKALGANCTVCPGRGLDETGAPL